MLHPILFCRYRKNRKRIIREVKKIDKEKLMSKELSPKYNPAEVEGWPLPKMA